MTEVAGRVAFITGGASGLGLGQAQVLGRAGARIAIADVRGDAVEDALGLLREQGIDAYGVTLDVTDREAYARAADEVEDALGPVTVLSNTAGVVGFGDVDRTTYADFDWVLGVDLGGVVNGFVTFVARMRDAGVGGHIVSVASMGAFGAQPAAVAYGAAKAAVVSLSESYRAGLARFGIGVSVACPASISSNLADSLQLRPDGMAAESSFFADEEFVDLQRQVFGAGMDPTELAGHILRAVRSDLPYVMPYIETRAGMREYFDGIIAAYDEYDSDAAAGSQRARDFAAYREGVAAYRAEKGRA